jgi:soluble lytic murein transglycosylase-like protein
MMDFKAAYLAFLLSDAVIRVESSGNPEAVSPTGAVGLMQVEPRTAREIATSLEMKVYDLKNPRINRMFGTYYLASLLLQFKMDKELALTAYHSGPTRVRNLLAETKGSSFGAIRDKLGPQGQVYAEKVLRYFNAGA